MITFKDAKLIVEDEEFNKYKNVSTRDIIKFGLNRFQIYKKMKYNVMALEV